jgi:hypothetical protein
VTDVITVGPRLWTQPIVDNDALWVLGWVGPSEVIARIDLQTRQVTHIVEGGQWAPLFFDDGVWISRGDGTVARMELP